MIVYRPFRRQPGTGPAFVRIERASGRASAAGSLDHGDDGVASAYVQSLLAHPDFRLWETEALT